MIRKARNKDNIVLKLIVSFIIVKLKIANIIIPIENPKNLCGQSNPSKALTP